jgi:subtilisin family serine protease
MGRREHEKVTVIGSYPSRSVALTEFSSSAQQNIGAKVEYEIYAPPGTIAETELVRLKWGGFANNTYGNKTLALISNQRKIGVLYGVASVEQNMEYTYGEWLLTSSRKPADLTAQYHAQKGVSFSDVDPLVVQFDNTSTANSVSSREYFVRYNYEKVV